MEININKFNKWRQKSGLDIELITEQWTEDSIPESSLRIRCRIKTRPKGQWTIKRAFNKIIKEQFDLENIEIPFNQLVVTNAQ